MTKRERVFAVLGGNKPDRTPVSFWHHFGPHDLRGRPAVDAHIRHLAKYDLDFLKIMNDTGFPRPGRDWVLEDASDLSDLSELTGNEPELEDELEIVRTLKKEVGKEVPMIVTVFNSWATLRRLTAPESDIHGPPKIVAEDERDALLTRMLKQDRHATQKALAKLARGLAKFSSFCVEAGADGIFLSVRDDWVDTPENGKGTYDTIVRSTDLDILKAVSSARFNILHVCGKALDFKRFTQYPAHVLNWADRYGGPSISEAKKLTTKALSGGVDNLNTLPNGTPEQVAAEARDAIAQAAGHPFMLTPGCTYDPNAVSDENLTAMIAAARS
jgi:uroporphyrinogen decarboxylase